MVLGLSPQIITIKTLFSTLQNGAFFISNPQTIYEFGDCIPQIHIRFREYSPQILYFFVVISEILRIFAI